MPKAIFCARCGIQLAMTRKAVKMQVIDVVEPHWCGEVQEVPQSDISGLEKALKPKEPIVPQTTRTLKSAKALLDSFPFVQKLNEAKKEVEHPSLQDVRQKRDEVVSSTEPLNIREMVLKQTGSSPSIRKDTHLEYEDTTDD